MTTVNVKPLVEALAWVKANPDIHDQDNPTICLVGHWVRTQPDFDNNITTSVDYFVSATGLPREKVEKLFINLDNDEAIDYAEHLIREYTVIESGDIPIGTRVKHLRHGAGVVIRHENSTGGRWQRVKWDNGHEDGYKIHVLTVIDTSTVAETEYWVNRDGITEYSTPNVEFAKGVADFFRNNSSVNVVVKKIVTARTEEIVS